MKYLLKIRKKLNEALGGVYLFGMFLILAIMLILAFFVEYYRVYNSISVADRAYEKAMLSVAIENYDEVFSTTRESSQIGGIFDGGNETEKDNLEKPDWVAFNDTGDIVSELEDLLNLELIDGNILVSYDSFGNIMYAISDFSMEIKETANYKDKAIKYEVQGEFHIEIPIYLFGARAKIIELNIPSKASWKSKL